MTGLRVNLAARLMNIAALDSLTRLEEERVGASVQRSNGYLNQYEWSRIIDQIDRRAIELRDAKYEGAA